MACRAAAVVLTLGLSLVGHTACAQNPFATPAPPPAGRPAAVVGLPAAPLPPPVLRPDQIQILRTALASAASHGLNPAAFATPGLDGLLQSPDFATRARGQAQLLSAVYRYARAVHVGQLASSGFIHEWGLRPAAYDPAADFALAVQGDRVGPWLDGLPPAYTGYQALRRSLAAYRAIADKGGWPILTAGPALTLGATDPRVAEVRDRLALEDPALTVGGPPLFDQPLAEAVTRAQKRFGLEPDGAINKTLIGALNTPVETRIRQIVANMERWRWLPPVLPGDRIQVNIAAAILSVFQDDRPIMSMRVVAGRPADQSPMLTSQVQSIVLNPPWNVPPSIATKELWPKERAHPGYLAAADFAIIPTGDGGVRLQQRAGPKSALGQVKFDFPNPYGVYLHDTPTHSTFSRLTRQASHGCIRVERPVDLAKLLLDGDPSWTPELIEAAIAKGDTVRAPLVRPISVFLLYWTAFVGPDGLTNFRPDPYDWDSLLLQRIAAGGPS